MTYILSFFKKKFNAIWTKMKKLSSTIDKSNDVTYYNILIEYFVQINFIYIYRLYLLGRILISFIYYKKL